MALKQNISWVNYTVWQKKKQDTSLSYSIPIQFRRLGNEIGIDWCTNSGQSLCMIRT